MTVSDQHGSSGDEGVSEKRSVVEFAAAIAVLAALLGPMTAWLIFLGWAAWSVIGWTFAMI